MSLTENRVRAHGRTLCQRVRVRIRVRARVPVRVRNRDSVCVSADYLSSDWSDPAHHKCASLSRSSSLHRQSCRGQGP